jgi:hypothetical protein
METNDNKIPVKLQRFLRLVALRSDIGKAKVVALIFRKNRIGLLGRTLPSATVNDWDLDSALKSIADELGTGDFSARYICSHDQEGVRHYSFEVETKRAVKARFVGMDSLVNVLGEEELRVVMNAIKRR